MTATGTTIGKRAAPGVGCVVQAGCFTVTEGPHEQNCRYSPTSRLAPSRINVNSSVVSKKRAPRFTHCRAEAELDAVVPNGTRCFLQISRIRFIGPATSG